MTTPLIVPAVGDLRVSLAVHEDSQYLHALGRNGQPFLHALVQNVSERPLKIWEEDCSLGNANLTLEVLALLVSLVVRPQRQGLALSPKAGYPRACYALWSSPTTLTSMMMAKATKCRPASVSGSRS